MQVKTSFELVCSTIRYRKLGLYQYLTNLKAADNSFTCIHSR